MNSSSWSTTKWWLWPFRCHESADIILGFLGALAAMASLWKNPLRVSLLYLVWSSLAIATELPVGHRKKVSKFQMSTPSWPFNLTCIIITPWHPRLLQAPPWYAGQNGSLLSPVYIWHIKLHNRTILHTKPYMRCWGHAIQQYQNVLHWKAGFSED